MSVFEVRNFSAPAPKMIAMRIAQMASAMLDRYRSGLSLTYPDADEGIAFATGLLSRIGADHPRQAWWPDTPRSPLKH